MLCSMSIILLKQQLTFHDVLSYGLSYVSNPQFIQSCHCPASGNFTNDPAELWRDVTSKSIRWQMSSGIGPGCPKCQRVNVEHSVIVIATLSQFEIILNVILIAAQNSTCGVYILVKKEVQTGDGVKKSVLPWSPDYWPTGQAYQAGPARAEKKGPMPTIRCHWSD